MGGDAGAPGEQRLWLVAIVATATLANAGTENYFAALTTTAKTGSRRRGRCRRISSAVGSADWRPPHI
jgi:hypothetical protein